MSGKPIIFVSSVQKEFADERRTIRDFVRGNRLLARNFDVFLFEDLPAKDRRPDDLYIEKVDHCAVYVGLFGKEYGWEDPNDGLSPTEREFDRATSQAKSRLLFLKVLAKGDSPDPKMRALIARASRQLVYKRFQDVSALTAHLYESLIEHLEVQGTIRTKPFDALPCTDVNLSDLSAERLKWFAATARRERNTALSSDATAKDVLTHLNLYNGDHPSNAAVLLFCDVAQRYISAAAIKCAHYHGVDVAKPIPSYQVFEGTLFAQVDQAVDFVMARLKRSVGTRQASASVPVEYEIAKEAVTEIIVNAVAHRDYESTASVQVAVFADRVEVSNPGRLPPGLTPDDLAKPHSSEPANPFICRPLYLAHYIEGLGTGTLDVIRRCHEAQLPVPDFEQRGGQFVVTLWRDWLSEAVLAEKDVTERQRVAVHELRIRGRLSNDDYQELSKVAKRTAHRDLTDLVQKGLLERVGTTGRGTYYILAKGARKGPKGPAAVAPKGAQKRPKGPAPRKAPKRSKRP